MAQKLAVSPYNRSRLSLGMGSYSAPRIPAGAPWTTRPSEAVASRAKPSEDVSPFGVTRAFPSPILILTAAGSPGVAALESERFRFELLKDNVFSGSEIGLWLWADSVSSVDSPQLFQGVGANAIEGGTVSATVTWTSQSIPWEVRGDIAVQGPGSPVLTLDAGLVLRFSPSTWLQIGSGAAGGLIARGTESTPVVLESVMASGQPGQWRGLVFGRNATRGGFLQNMVIRHGGQPEVDVLGCVTIRSEDDAFPMSIMNSTFEFCEGSAIAAPGENFEFEALMGNTFQNSPTGLYLSPRAVTSVSAQRIYQDVQHNRIAPGTLSTHATWSPQPVPWAAAGPILVEGAADPTLTINAGTSILFEGSASLAVGVQQAGSLVIGGSDIRPVIFSSHQDNPSPGSWPGVFLGPRVSPGTRIDFLELSYAGQPSADVQAAMTLQGTGTNVLVANSTFRSNLQADIYVDCGSQPLLSSNQYDGPGVRFEQNCP